MCISAVGYAALLESYPQCMSYRDQGEYWSNSSRVELSCVLTALQEHHSILSLSSNATMQARRCFHARTGRLPPQPAFVLGMPASPTSRRRRCISAVRRVSPLSSHVWENTYTSCTIRAVTAEEKLYHPGHLERLRCSTKRVRVGHEARSRLCIGKGVEQRSIDHATAYESVKECPSARGGLVIWED